MAKPRPFFSNSHPRQTRLAAGTPFLNILCPHDPGVWPGSLRLIVRSSPFPVLQHRPLRPSHPIPIDVAVACRI